MRWSCRARTARGASRSGMTLIEVMLALAIFMIGSVSVIGLFATASVLHAEAVNRRTASFIAADLLAGAKSMRFREVFARTALAGDIDDVVIGIPAASVDADVDSQAANFDLYPLSDLFFPVQEGQDPGRGEGALLIEGEWVWYGGLSIGPPDDFVSCDRGQWGTTASAHSVPPLPAEQWMLHARTWFYVVDAALGAAEVAAVTVEGDPAGSPGGGPLPGAPPSGYIVIDDEWMSYDDTTPLSFTGLTRGQGGTQAVAHGPGTPVTVAREHPSYPGFYYTVQFYPVNASGASAHMVVCVAYTTGNMLRVHTFRSIYTPAGF